jgi:hypothetical protein
VLTVFAPHALHLLISAHVYAYAIDHVESELAKLPEQAHAEDNNTDPDQGKPWCI